MIEVKNYANSKYWKALVEHFAEGKELCNCREAYYATDGEYWLSGDKTNTTYHNGRYCPSGCSANQYKARDEIAKKMIDLLNGEQNAG